MYRKTTKITINCRETKWQTEKTKTKVGVFVKKVSELNRTADNEVRNITTVCKMQFKKN